MSVEVIASHGICNNASLNIFEAEEERVLVAINNNRPNWYKLYTTDKGVYFNFRGIRYYLSEFIRVNI